MLVPVQHQVIYFNTLRPRQDGWNFADNILNAFSSMKAVVIWLTFHWNMFRRFQLTTRTTRTTRTPAFWGYPPPPHDYPFHWVILDPKSKEDKVKVTNLKNKISNILILKQALHATHLHKLLDKMCKYEMDPMSIVEDTERTRFCPQMDRWTNGQTDKVIPVYPPFNFVEAGGIIILHWFR